jgi:uncharacterized damage-inducible protein DinB
MAMSDLALTDYMVQLYQYNDWANRRVLTVAAGLTEEELFHEHGHSWGSIFGVLLHILNAEWIWLRRWQGESPGAFPEVEQYPTFAHLAARWDDIETEMRAFVEAQTPDSLQKEIKYTTTRGEVFHLKLWQMMVHVVNHGTHHRGELAAMFATLGIPHPEEDWLHYFLIESGQRVG